MPRNKRLAKGPAPSDLNAPPTGSAATVKKISDLTPDARNANKGSLRGNAVIADSLRRYGARRSILLDRHGAIIAGNKTAENAGAIGMEDVLVIQTTGDRLVAVQRMDLDLDSPAARELAIADNRASEVSLSWDLDVLQGLVAEGGVDLAPFWTAGEQFRAAFRGAGFHLASCLIWKKNSLVLGHSDYQWRHEPVLYGWRPGAGHSWHGGRAQTTILEFDGSPVRQLEDGSWIVQFGDDAFIVRGEGVTVELAIGDVFTEDKPIRNAEHPTMKPVSLIERMLVNSTLPGAAVIDFFGGSGSTLVACEKLRLRCFMLELDPRYVDVIVTRWEQLTGKKAVLHGQATQAG